MSNTRKWNVVITLKFYGDESADGTKSRVFAVAAVVGTEDEWGLAMREWLRRTRGLPFHATDLESKDAQHPDRQKHKDNLKLYEDLTKILSGSYLAGFAVALDLAAHRELLPDVPPDVAYYKCLADVIRFAADAAQQFNGNPKEQDDVRLEFTFDSRLESDGTAGVMYTTLRTLPEWADTGIFDTKITFEEGIEPRLEMADLLARESMKELDRKITNDRPKMRESRRVLDESNKFRFVEHDRAYCERWRVMVEQPESQADLAEYMAWLQRTGCQDTMANRYRFFAGQENRDALKKKRDGGSSSGAA